MLPWLVWLSGLSAGLTIKGSVASSIPSQGTRLGCRPGPQCGMCKRQPHINVSLTLFFSPSPSENKILKNTLAFVLYKKSKD